MTKSNGASDGPSSREIELSLERIRALAAQGQLLSAEVALRALVQQHAGLTEAWMMLAELAEHRGDAEQAMACVRQARDGQPDEPELGLQLAEWQARAGQLAEAVATIEQVLQLHPQHFVAWLALGEALELAGRPELAARARFQGVNRGQKAGYLLNMQSTPSAWQPVIGRIIAQVNAAHQHCVDEALADLRGRFGAAELKRVDRAAAGYLRREQHAPPNPHQAPKFFFFPGLPDGPYHDPYLHPWTHTLVDAWQQIREEAQALLHTEGALEDFLGFKAGQSTEGYLGGAGPKPAWDAFFFYRHGQVYESNHQRAPKTSALLKAADLCHVAGQAPEVCFSVLQPGTHLMPHYGVTNTRLVMHLPLIVPPDCALNVLGEGVHEWREGVPMMFDDSFQHEAWNRSDRPRMILLMDCWNPHLSAIEREATRHLIEQISTFENIEPGGLLSA